MLRESFSHAKEDEAARALREAQVDADRLLEAVTAALAADGEALLSAAERADIDGAMQALRVARAGSAIVSIKRAAEAVDAATREFAARRMDAGIRKALAGHRLEEFHSLPPGERK
jgi:molecular chaperone HscA